MRRVEDPSEANVDEYLWPLTGNMAAVDWSALAEELQIRERLAAIKAHVYEMHVRPRLARLHLRRTPAETREVTGRIIEGPPEGPLWEQTLKDPVPRALREEWSALTQRLRELHGAPVARRRQRAEGRA